jgi:hypothetical protein
VKSTKIAAALRPMVAGTGSRSVTAAQVEPAKTAIAPEKMPTIGQRDRRDAFARVRQGVAGARLRGVLHDC